MDIEIQNSTKHEIDDDFIRRIVQKALAYLGITSDVSLDITIVTDKEIQKLNKEYHHKDEPTDILSFGANEKFVMPKEQGEYRGQLILCIEEIQRNAKELDMAYSREFAHVVIHGILHLYGFEHESSSKKAKEMHQHEEIIMDELGL